MDFSASAIPEASLTVNWYRGGDLVGQDPVLNFVPLAVGRDTLQVNAFSGAVRDTYYWVIDVEEDITSVPPEVPNVDAQAGPDPADVAVSWIRVSGATFPLEEYLVAVSYDGPISESNWDQATILGSFPPVPGEVGFYQVFSQLEHGMRPGETAWFSVRVRDDRQQLSPLTESVRHDITWPWYLGGTVSDDAGLPLSLVGVRTGLGDPDNTDGQGVFVFNDPFRNIDSVRVATTANGPYNFISEPVTAQEETTFVNITLINQYDLADPSCWTGEFLDYLRIMTRTVEVPGVPAESQLFTWDEYPVSVYIPPGEVNEAGVDLEPPCLAALEFWNFTMQNDADLLGIEETDYFVRTTDQGNADIVLLFEHRPQNYGEVKLLLPAGKVLGEVIPEKMELWINTTAGLDEFSKVQGVAVHEFGHTLGMFSHADCPNVGYLMEAAGGAGAMDRPEPIHLDERRAIRAIRVIPQGANMMDYSLGGLGAFEWPGR